MKTSKYFKYDCWINKGIRSSFYYSFEVTKVKKLVNKVLKTLFQKKTLVTPNDRKYPNLIPLSASTKGKSLPGVLLYWVPCWNRIGTLLTSKKVPSLSEKGAKLIVETIWTYILYILKFGIQCLPNYKHLIIKILQNDGHCPPISELQMYRKQNCLKNKGIRSSYHFTFDVTKVKILVNKVLKTMLPKKTLFSPKTLVTPNDQKYPNLIPLLDYNTVSCNFPDTVRKIGNHTFFCFLFFLSYLSFSNFIELNVNTTNNESAQ